jgi:hypothetical protein
LHAIAEVQVCDIIIISNDYFLWSSIKQLWQ